MNKTVTRLGKMGDINNDDFVPGSPSSRLGLIWPLTQEVTSLSKDHDAKRRLQRNLTVVNRRKR